MDFKKNQSKDQNNPSQNEDDSYVKEMKCKIKSINIFKARLLIKKHKGAIGEENLGKFYIQDE